MNNFNKELIKNIKLYSTENSEDFIEDKYSFIRYVFSNFESISEDNISFAASCKFITQSNMLFSSGSINMFAGHCEK